MKAQFLLFSIFTVSLSACSTVLTGSTRQLISSPSAFVCDDPKEYRYKFENNIDSHYAKLFNDVLVLAGDNPGGGGEVVFINANTFEVIGSKYLDYFDEDFRVISRDGIVFYIFEYSTLIRYDLNSDTIDWGISMEVSNTIGAEFT